MVEDQLDPLPPILWGWLWLSPSSSESLDPLSLPLLPPGGGGEGGPSPLDPLDPGVILWSRGPRRLPSLLHLDALCLPWLSSSLLESFGSSGSPGGGWFWVLPLQSSTGQWDRISQWDTWPGITQYASNCLGVLYQTCISVIYRYNIDSEVNYLHIRVTRAWYTSDMCEKRHIWCLH